jgi:hypothetical protein
MIPYKGRHIKGIEPIEVYRNLRKRDGVWYSIRQHGKVVGHAREVSLSSCEFVVNEAGRKRVLKTGRKNVHAFVRGVFIGGANARYYARYSARYNPKTLTNFVYRFRDEWRPLERSRYAYLGQKGLVVGPYNPVACGVVGY